MTDETTPMDLETVPLRAVAVPLRAVAVLPEPEDNAAVASRVLPAGTRVALPDGQVVTLPHRVMEGHRIVIAPIASGAPILSWGTPFATALRDLHPGDYICTGQTLEALTARGVPGLPERPSAENVMLDPYAYDPADFADGSPQLGEQVAADGPARTFRGYRRPGGRVGTRNHIVVLGVTSRSAAFAEALAARFAGRTSETFDGVVAVAHTEAGESSSPNNRDFVLGVLAGTLVHPNVGGVLIINEPRAALSAQDILGHHDALGLPPITAEHEIFTRSHGFSADLDAAAATIESWIERVGDIERTEEPLSGLNIALQCGGSDAFSGISANPLAGLVGAEAIKHGGTAVLAETDELIGAEDYVLRNVRTREVAEAFLERVQEFKERVSWHGHTAEGNPSGGNVFRGLTNIVLKSLGAARKLPPAVRLDHVIRYAEPCPGTGYIFMDSPGNDLESIAGQVASGSNLIFFTTGNGSITNFPFVPTLKFVTTSARHDLMPHEMDVNAGEYLDGTPMEQLVEATFDLTLDIASGRRSAGERAGHSQVSIWRNWKQTGPRPGISVSIDGRTSRGDDEVPLELRDADLPAQPVPGSVEQARAVAAHSPAPAVDLDIFPTGATEHVALVLPTSLCSGQVARQIATKAQAGHWAAEAADRVVALPHTEGCGVSSGANISTFSRVMVGALTHPNVRLGLLLEHGCEKTHNDFFRGELAEDGIDASRYGWASIQLGGGIDATTETVHEWMTQTARTVPAEQRQPGRLGGLSIALEARGALSAPTARALALLGSWVVADGGSIILAAGGSLLADDDFRQAAFGATPATDPSPADDSNPAGGTMPATLAHGQRPAAPGWHIMRTPTDDWTEVATGFVAAGAHLTLVHVEGDTVSGQSLAPVLQVSADPLTVGLVQDDLDAELEGDTQQQAATLLGVVAQTASGRHTPESLAAGNVAFQITRGMLGTSM